MKPILPALSLCLALTPLWAQESAPEAAPAQPVPETQPETAPEDMGDGIDLIEEGAKLLLRGLMSEVEPALKDMEQALTEMEPALQDLMRMIGDIRNYHPPEMLPNGDIIIRRKTPLEAEPEGEIEL